MHFLGGKLCGSLQHGRPNPFPMDESVARIGLSFFLQGFGFQSPVTGNPVIVLFCLAFEGGNSHAMMGCEEYLAGE